MHKYFMLIALFFAACSDKDSVDPPPATPAMHYTNLEGKEVKPGNGQGLDIDGNGSIDFIFYVIHIGDPLFREDKFRFLASSLISCNLLVDPDNQSPVLSKNAAISTGNQPPYEWFEVSEVFLAEKVVGVNNPVYWRGPWKDVSHKYLAVQLVKNNQRYNGWVELSFDTAGEKLLLHKAAICLEAGKNITAGK